MAETAAKTTTPRRTRRTTPSTSKAATGTAKPRAKAQTAMAAVTFELRPEGPSRKGTYTVFELDTDTNGNDTGCVGKFYAPLGATGLTITVAGPAGALEEIEAATDVE